ncbi:hypothetical protein E1A91_D11G273900v1 [Gossypium mustelinum]|uniref:Uncharacterized protein n=1 Tax=Gossypium mustelinum TaxID=34275 RepID=A0A5D2SY73_GOSMU|nr:hypothetical protein E1A91_D11G273900v1 [Gossypium mustelinum]
MFHYAKAIFICFSCDSEASFFPSTYPRFGRWC